MLSGIGVGGILTAVTLSRCPEIEEGAGTDVKELVKGDGLNEKQKKKKKEKKR